MTEPELDELIYQHIPVVDHRMAMIMGYFVGWYSVGELAITGLLAAMSETDDLVRFEILTKGMDARVKIDRIKQLGKVGGGLGPNLTKRLDYFYRRIAKIRNRMLHSCTRQKTNKVGQYQFISVAAWAEGHMSDDQLNTLPTDVTAKELLELGNWLCRFNADVSLILPSVTPGSIVEIDDPQSNLPSDGPPGPH